jgi:hypothetical protein
LYRKLERAIRARVSVFRVGGADQEFVPALQVVAAVLVAVSVATRRTQWLP